MKSNQSNNPSIHQGISHLINHGTNHSEVLPKRQMFTLLASSFLSSAAGNQQLDVFDAPGIFEGDPDLSKYAKNLLLA